MRYWVGLTDRDWFDYLSAQTALDEVNFWQPGARRPVVLDPGAPFLFKLHARHGGAIAGGGYFAHFTALPARIAWETFGTANGAPTFAAMAARIRRYRPGFDVDADSIGLRRARPAAPWGGPSAAPDVSHSTLGYAGVSTTSPRPRAVSACRSS
jgi:hypothetical protein